MDKRIRSPNYPALSLPEAIEKVTALYRAQHKHAGPRDVVARGLGYNSLNGASATAISALHKYGLLERVGGDEIKISERALRILTPLSAEERSQAILEAASDPPLFEELNDRFPDKMPNDDLLRNYLVRKGFAPAALTSVISAYRETSEMVERETRGHDSRNEQPQDHAAMTHHASSAEPPRSIAPMPPAPPTSAAPVIAIMNDHLVVNMTVRSREQARTLRTMIETVEALLPESVQNSVSAPETNPSGSGELEAQGRHDGSAQF